MCVCVHCSAVSRVPEEHATVEGTRRWCVITGAVEVIAEAASMPFSQLRHAHEDP